MSTPDDNQRKSTGLNSEQREIPVLGAMRGPVEVDWSLIAQCNDEQDALLLCVHLSRLSNEEIARHLGKREGAIRALQMRGLKALSKRLVEKVPV